MKDLLFSAFSIVSTIVGKEAEDAVHIIEKSAASRYSLEKTYLPVNVEDLLCNFKELLCWVLVAEVLL